ncbi:hypothetical protein [Brucella endophytica]|nr:hypothetical protein [Brucella endophytica]
MATGELAAAEQLAYCAPGQLEIRQIAYDRPGMMKVNAFFAVLNRGSAPCTLRAAAGRLWSNNRTPPGARGAQSLQSLEQTYLQSFGNAKPSSPKRYVLPPLPPNGKMALKDIVGFSVSNSAGSGTGAWFSSLSVQLPNSGGRPARRIYKVPYKGDTSFPIPKIDISLQPFLTWSALGEDGCITAVGSKPFVGAGSAGDDIPIRTIDVRKVYQCG